VSSDISAAPEYQRCSADLNDAAIGYRKFGNPITIDQRSIGRSEISHQNLLAEHDLAMRARYTWIIHANIYLGASAQSGDGTNQRVRGAGNLEAGLSIGEGGGHLGTPS
jgi:hypothetical protein